MNKARNNAKIVDEIARLRDAKQELREFEREIDNELPSRKKLQEFRELAKELIENAPGKTINNNCQFYFLVCFFPRWVGGPRRNARSAAK